MSRAKLTLAISTLSLELLLLRIALAGLRNVSLDVDLEVQISLVVQQLSVICVLLPLSTTPKALDLDLPF